MDYLVRIFKSVANETRVRILEFLINSRQKEETLESMAAALKLPYKTVSRNLQILEKAMLMKSRRWGGKAYFSLETSPRLVFSSEILKMIRKRVLRREKRSN